MKRRILPFEMKKVGLIGGTSWHSTATYYRMINLKVNAYFGNNTNPPLYLANLNQQEIHHLEQEEKWHAIAQIILQKALQMQSLGVHALVLCANTLHKIIDRIDDQLQIPFLHIGDALGCVIRQKSWVKVGLLGTQFTMSEDFLKRKLLHSYQINCLVPGETEQIKIQEHIISELSHGIFSKETQQYFLKEAAELSFRGAQAIILGCTEIPLLMSDCMEKLPMIDSLECHCSAIVKFILNIE